MRISITSNAPWSPTGYGVQTASLSKLLKVDGYDVSIASNYGLAGTTISWEGIPVFGSGMDAYSNDLNPAQMHYWLKQDQSSVGLGLTLYDVWVYSSPEWDEFPIASWVPVDHVGVPVGVLNWFKRDKSGKWAIAMSKFGKQQLIESGVEKDRVFYAPHSVNTSVFRPEQPDFRPSMTIPPDAHLTFINSANKGLTPIRKCWPEMLEAWVKFSETRPDAYLVIWTEINGIANGVNIPRLLDHLKAPRDRVRIVPQFDYRQGISHNILAQAYASSDVLLMASRGEGFGVPAIEAQACGTPVIVTDWTAQSELVGSGWKIDGQREWDEFQIGWWKVPNVDQIISALEESYSLKGDTKRSKAEKEKAVAFAALYEEKSVYDTYWKPVLKTLEDEIRANANKK